MLFRSRGRSLSSAPAAADGPARRDAAAHDLGVWVQVLPDPQAAIALAGPDASILRKLEALTGVSLVMRGLDLVVQGRPPQIERVRSLIQAMEPLWSRGEPISEVDVLAAHRALSTGQLQQHQMLTAFELGNTVTGRSLRPRTVRQRVFVEAMQRHDLTLAIGPAGTGKTAFSPPVFLTGWKS